MNTKEFIEKSRQIFGDVFDYSKTNFCGWHEKLCITCPKHGDIWVAPNNHLHSYKQGCTKCNCEKHFLEKSKLVHGNKYDYSKVIYVDSKTKICIICPEHGEFWQLPGEHLSGRGCKKCAGNYKKSTEQFISESKELYGDDFFDYSETVYNGAHEYATFRCKKHGCSFEQEPDNHLRWNGCPFCKTSKLEDCIRKLLNENGVLYEEQKTFDWLVFKDNMYLDFFIASKNIAIECQGEQHFETFRFKEDTIEKLELRMKRDAEKKRLCEEHGIKIIYFGNKMKYKTCCGDEIVFNKKIILDKLNESN